VLPVESDRHLGVVVSRLCILAFLVLVLVPHPALGARTVAVLPLEQGAGSEVYAGLGTALAGMLVSDLSRAEALQLVERGRLDDLLEEIALGEGDFLDPATAQKLGAGLGAEMVVTGSFSVMGQTFLLDARVVAVESAAILKAVDAQGTVEDFVTVEKDLVEALLDGLEVSVSSSVRRKMLSAAPTEDFGAFSSYGQGLDHQATGRIEQARASFEAALAIDPEFAEARDAVAAMRDRVEQERAQAAQSVADRKGALRQAVLERVPDERARADGFAYDARTLGELSLRWMVLAELDLHCQVYDEMWHYLDRVDWQVSQPAQQDGHDLFETTMLTAIEWELIEHPGRLRTIPFDNPTVASMPVLFVSTPRFVLDLAAADPSQPKGDGLFTAMLHCFTPAEQLAEIERMAERARKADVADQVESDSFPGVTLDDHLQTAWAILRAKHFGASEDVQRRTEAVLERHTDDSARAWAVRRMEKAAFMGDLWDMRQTQRLGLSDEMLLAATEAAALGEGAAIRWDSPYCAAVATQAQSAAEWNWKRYQAMLDEGEPQECIDDFLPGLGVTLGSLLALGCIAGREGVVGDVYETYAWVGAADQRIREDHAGDERCVQALELLPQRTDPTTLDPYEGNPQMLHHQAKYLLDWYYGALVIPRCVEL